MDYVEVFKSSDPSSSFRKIYPWVYMIVEAINYILAVKYFLDPSFKWVDLSHLITGSNIHYAPGKEGDPNQSWWKDILSNYPVFLIYISFKLLEM